MKKIDIKENLHWIIPSFITAWWFVVWKFWIWIVFLLGSLIYIIYHFWNKIIVFYNNKLKILTEKEKFFLFWNLMKNETRKKDRHRRVRLHRTG